VIFLVREPSKRIIKLREKSNPLLAFDRRHSSVSIEELLREVSKRKTLTKTAESRLMKIREELKKRASNPHIGVSESMHSAIALKEVDKLLKRAGK
jgi:hypothetical protein